MGGQRLPGEAELLRALPALNAMGVTEPTKMPLEARMYGIFAGFLLSWLVAIGARRGRATRPAPPWLMITFIAFIGIMGLDGLNATLFDLSRAGLPALYLYAPRLDLRLATGLLSGIGIAGLAIPAVNSVLWRNGTPEPVFADAFDLAALLIWNAILFGMVVSGSGLLFYPVSLLGVLGVLALIGALNIVMVMSIFPRDAAALTWQQALNPIALSLLFTGIELAALSLLRYALFGAAVLS